MPLLSALLHTHDDALRLGRALESLRPCEELLVVDHGSTDHTERVAREHGATVIQAAPGCEPGAYAAHARHDWILCLLPNEALTEELEAALHEWKRSGPDEATGFALAVREETASGWRRLQPELRLVNRRSVQWAGRLPPADAAASCLPGDLLRFTRP